MWQGRQLLLFSRDSFWQICLKEIFLCVAVVYRLPNVRKEATKIDGQ